MVGFNHVSSYNLIYIFWVYVNMGVYSNLSGINNGNILGKSLTANGENCENS